MNEREEFFSFGEEKNKVLPSTLYLVTTPIGNLADIGERALKVLRECSFVAAEDTRNTRKLLSHFDIHKELVSYHEHNKHQMGPALCERIAKGETCALVTDAVRPRIFFPVPAAAVVTCFSSFLYSLRTDCSRNRSSAPRCWQRQCI